MDEPLKNYSVEFMFCEVYEGCTPPKTSRPALFCKLAVFMLTKEV